MFLFVKGITSAFTIHEIETERKMSLIFGLNLPLDLVNIVLLFNKSFKLLFKHLLSRSVL